MKQELTVALALVMLCCSAHARKVSGTVKSGEEKLQGVIVTDGKNFAQTGKNGNFSFEIKDDAEFVYIVTPSGYVADWSSGVPEFYQEAAGKSKFSFDLLPTGKSGDYSIIALADPQTNTEEHFGKFAGEPMEDVCATAKNLGGTVVGLALGDICWDNLSLLEDYRKEIRRAGIPFYPVVGNHDHDWAVQGDVEASAGYRRIMGPENYAFFIGKDVVVVLDNIIYDTQYKHQCGYANHVISWLKGLEALLPDGADIYVAQHSPMKNVMSGRKIMGTSDVIDIVRGRKVTFLSGHTHVNNFIEYEKDITEHNIAAICGAWWDTVHCTDGTPRGYKVFTKDSGRLTWYYKSVGQPKDYQAQVYRPGQAPLHPNSVVVNVWDWNPLWKVEWFEDGKPMGSLKPEAEYSPVFIREINDALKGTEQGFKRPSLNIHYFAATPSQYARNVTVAVEDPFGKSWVYNVDMTEYVDVQAHRGGAGLMPENTIEAMKHALDMGVNTLELDLQVSADGQVVVSHDPYFHHRYAIRPDGSLVREGDPKEYIYNMPYSEIAKYDVGSRPSERWPEQADVKTVKPLAGDLIDFVENYTKEKGYSPVRYNIEIKSLDAAGEGQNWPTYDAFVSICCKFLHSKHLGDRLVVQSFDVRALNYMHEKYPEFYVSYLVDEDAPDFEEYMKKLTFTPQWLSPHHSLADEALVQKCREKGMKIVPWTVDEPEDIKRILDLGVDAIISNYPDRVLMQTRGFIL